MKKVVRKLAVSLAVSMIMVFSLALSTLAGGEVTKSFKLTRESKVNGQVLKEGDYAVKFADDKEGELILLKGKKEIAKANYKFKELKESAADNAVAYSMDGDGSLHLKRLEFKGMKTAIVFE